MFARSHGKGNKQEEGHQDSHRGDNRNHHPRVASDELTKTSCYLDHEDVNHERSYEIPLRL